MSTLKQIEANRRNSQLSTGPTSQAGKAVSRMNRLDTGIDAQSQIIPGEDPEALVRLTGQYYERFLPQGPEEAALIDTAIASDWLLRRLRKTKAEIWDRSITDKLENEQKWNKKPERYRLAEAYQRDSKLLERLQRRLSAAERSLRASLETFARLRKQITSEPVGPAILSEVGPAILSPANVPVSPPHPVGPMPPATPSEQTSIPEIGFVPEIPPEPGGADPQVCAGPPGPAPRDRDS